MARDIQHIETSNTQTLDKAFSTLDRIKEDNQKSHEFMCIFTNSVTRGKAVEEESETFNEKILKLNCITEFDGETATANKSFKVEVSH